jgi:FKBP-type peptidyl-prolyl cis-trans isomerase SlyD
MPIASNKVVTIDYTLTDDQGTVIDKSANGNFAYLHGAKNIIPGLENALAGKEVGDEVSIKIPPAEGYGERDETLKQEVSREMFQTPDEIEVGKQFHAQTPSGQQIVITVTNVAEEKITVDGNHPLAGENLNFDVKVVDIRDASEEELTHGHVHGPGGHEHG